MGTTMDETIGEVMVQATGMDVGPGYSHSTVEWVAAEVAKRALESLPCRCSPPLAVIGRAGVCDRCQALASLEGR